MKFVLTQQLPKPKQLFLEVLKATKEDKKTPVLLLSPKAKLSRLS